MDVVIAWQASPLTLPYYIQILEALGIDYIDESEVLTPADEDHHINKTKFTVPFVNGAKDLGEALRRINEGSCMIRTKVLAHCLIFTDSISQLGSRAHDVLHPLRLNAYFVIIRARPALATLSRRSVTCG